MNNFSKSLSKAPSVLTAIACVASFAMLITLLLFQGGILYSMGLTMLTSDILVTAITIVLAVCAALSLAAMIRSMVANKKNKKLIHNIVADVAGSKESEKAAPAQAKAESKPEPAPVAANEPVEDDEPEEANGEPVPEMVSTATHVAPSAEDSNQTIVGSVASKGMDDTTLDAINKIMAQNDEHDMTPPVMVAPAIQPAKQDKAEPVEEKAEEAPAEAPAPVAEEPIVPDIPEQPEPVAEEPVSEPETPAPAEEPVEETPAEEEQPAVELTKFENSMVMLMKRGNVPEEVYAIEEYKEGAVCLTHDKEHYFVYICKDNDATDVEYFPIHDEKAVAMAFATRIRNKMNEGKKSA